MTKKLGEICQHGISGKDGTGDSPVGVVQYTCQSIVPSQERCEKAKESSGLDDWRIGRTGRVAAEIANAQQKKGHIESEEEQEESDS